MPAVPAAVETVAASVKGAVGQAALSIEAAVDAVAARLQPMGQVPVPVAGGDGRAMVVPGFDAVAALVEASLDAVAPEVQAAIHAIAVIPRRSGG
ncbi:MAG: hypothetical protein EOP91_03830 [Lysobacteraceae bacterium]|nr:MAG: hypothetical protein EOP91_03830 [Xanthomonadaceae bacterium]